MALVSADCDSDSRRVLVTVTNLVEEGLGQVPRPAWWPSRTWETLSGLVTPTRSRKGPAKNEGLRPEPELSQRSPPFETGQGLSVSE